MSKKQKKILLAIAIFDVIVCTTAYIAGKKLYLAQNSTK